MTSLNRRRFLGTGVMAGAAAATLQNSRLQGGEDPQVIEGIGKTPHTKFAVNVEMWWTKLPFPERLEQAARFGFPAVEFWPWRNKDLRAIEEFSKRTGTEIAQFTAWGFTPGMNDPRNHEACLKEIEASCAVAKQLKCKLMTVVGGNDQPGMTQEQMHDNIITCLKRAAPIAGENDITLILEPMNIRVDHKGHCLYGSAPSIRICNEVNSPFVKINWDLYHMHITEGDLCGHLREGMEAGRVGYLQLADHPGRHEPGTGELHYNRVLKEAQDLGYKGFVGLECKPSGSEEDAARRVAAADVW